MDGAISNLGPAQSCLASLDIEIVVGRPQALPHGVVCFAQPFQISIKGGQISRYDGVVHSIARACKAIKSVDEVVVSVNVVASEELVHAGVGTLKVGHSSIVV